jgi:hypothetical protein
MMVDEGAADAIVDEPRLETLPGVLEQVVSVLILVTVFVTIVVAAAAPTSLLFCALSNLRCLGWFTNAKDDATKRTSIN